MKQESLYTLLSKRYGWQLDSHRPAAVERAIANRAELLRISTPEEYMAGLLEDSLEFQNLLEELVIPESWFYREAEALNLLVDQLRRPNQVGPLRLLSAPCARGEEPCTVSMMLQEAGWSLDSFRIDAIDLSLLSIERARQGLYSEYSFRGSSADLRERYFVPHDSIWKVLPKVVEQIEYSQQNIFELPVSFAGYHAILCRNLLIYLTEEGRRRLFSLLHNILRPDGYLVVAACEFALPPADLFRPIQKKGVVVFQAQSLQSIPVPPQIQVTSGAAAARLRPSPPVTTSPTGRTSSSKNSPGKSWPLKSPTEKLALEKTVSSRLGSSATNSKSASTDPASKTLLQQAREAADGGDLGTASTCCLRYLEQETTADGYYLLGVIYSAQGHLDDAEANFRRALYLAPDHGESLSQLALCRELSGDLDGAQRLRQRRARLTEGQR